MKWLSLIVLCSLVVGLNSCGFSEKADAAIISEEKVTTETLNKAEDAQLGISSYNFSDFENRFMNTDNDTTYVINFWATWCRPCIKELPIFETVNKAYSDQKVKVVLVSLDFPRNVEKSVIPFLKREKIASEVILLDDTDSNTWIPKVNEKWSGVIPATLLRKEGKNKFHEGLMTLDQLEEEIQQLQ